MALVVEENDQLKVRKRIKFKVPPKRRGVKLVRPGWNLPTMGALLMVLIHCLIEVTGGIQTHQELYHYLGISWFQLGQGYVWGLFTHSFLHGSWTHVGLNALLFFYASARVGHILSARKITLLFFGASALAGLMHSMMQGLFPVLLQWPLVGASGGVIGLLLAQTEIFPDSRMLLLPVSGRNMGRGVLVSSLLLFLLTPGLGVPAFSQVGTFVGGLCGEDLFMIGHFYHFIGGLVGLLLVGRLLPPMITLDQLQAERARNERSAH